MKKLISLGMVLGLMACAKAPQGQPADLKTPVQGIIGGEAVSADDPIAHSTVQLYILIQEKDEKTGQVGYNVAECTGSLISEDVVLTAGHCTQENPKQIFVYFSKDVPKDLNEFLKGLLDNPLVHEVIGGVTAPAWAKLNDKKLKNWGDIALLKFQGKAPADYTPANLITKETKLVDGMPITLAGFGLTQPLVDQFHQVEATELRKVTVSIQQAKYSRTEIMLATGQGKGSCHGDSGGPGFVTAGGENVIAGITSRADIDTDPKGACTGLTVYTAVAPYLKWISESVSYLDSDKFQPAPIEQPHLSL
jgi:secreted trypsin-like serine protease